MRAWTATTWAGGLQPRHTQGPGPGLRQPSGAATLPVHLAWFADGPGDGIAKRDDLEVPIAPFGDKGTRCAADLVDLLWDCGWAPGFDLWDPLEEGLRIVARPILAGPPSSGILIVGNSPPNLPLDAGPFRDLLRYRGMESTARRCNAVFTQPDARPGLAGRAGRVSVLATRSERGGAAGP